MHESIMIMTREHNNSNNSSFLSIMYQGLCRTRTNDKAANTLLKKPDSLACLSDLRHKAHSDTRDYGRQAVPLAMGHDVPQYGSVAGNAISWTLISKVVTTQCLVNSRLIPQFLSSILCLVSKLISLRFAQFHCTCPTNYQVS